MNTPRKPGWIELNIEVQVIYGELEQIAPDEIMRQQTRRLREGHKQMCETCEIIDLESRRQMKKAA